MPPLPFQLQAESEWIAHDPFGELKATDRSRLSWPVADRQGVRLTGARNGYVSFRLIVTGRGDYQLHVDMPAPVEADLYKAWYHRMAKDKRQAGKYLPDALTPVTSDQPQRLPDRDNAVPGQTHQEFWVDLFVPSDAPVGVVGGRAVLQSPAGPQELPIRLEVVEAMVSDEDVITTDHNSYGSRWVMSHFAAAFAGIKRWPERWGKIIQILHHYYRICREHRGLFHNLGAGHAGTFDPIYGPRVEGSGKRLKLTDWGLFDRHYGPLLDGSAFATACPGLPRPRRPARSLETVYTAINAAWPADYLWWGQPGYEVEFTRGLGQFDEHLRRKGWTRTRMEFFFNHKKRYRWFEWDGDEPKYSKDDKYFLEMGRLYKKVTPPSPVPWVFRMDASWQMKNNFADFAGLVNFYVCGGFAQWYPRELAEVVRRGDIAWTYSGTPGCEAFSSALLEHVWKMWARGAQGHCEWLTVQPGEDPWFHCDGASTGMIYPGERFGIAGPIPSIRLKLQRNAVQDINLLHARAAAGGGVEQVRQKLAARVPVTLWTQPPPIVLERPAEEWDSNNLSQKTEVNMAQHQGLDPLWWTTIRQAALGKETL